MLIPKVVLPNKPLPIYIIGAGGIVNDAHLPAYKIAGFAVAGIYDLDKSKAAHTAEKFGIPQVFESLESMVAEAPAKAIFDVAVPGSVIKKILLQLPNEAYVLMQKPMGDNLQQAQEILEVCRSKKLVAAVNFQLRYAPYIAAARHIINTGLIGEICDVEVNVNVYTPWHLWSFLNELPRVEILYHSIHYVDLIRSFLGNPDNIQANTTKHPLMKQLASVKSDIIMDYGDYVRANIRTNHTHLFGLENQHAYIKFEGTKGAIKLRLGVLLNYPEGIPDRFEYVVLEEGKEPEWQMLDIEGTWFPHAFIGSMGQMMLFAEGAIKIPGNSVEDCIDTMRCVEAAYIASGRGGVKLAEVS